MVKDDQENDRSVPATRGGMVGSVRRELFSSLSGITAVVLVAILLCGFAFYRFAPFGVTRSEASPGTAGAPVSKQRKQADFLFHNWPKDKKPDVVLMLTGQQHGYMQPCGCSEPQLGGLERRYNFKQQLIKERKWPVISLDLGDIAGERRPPQALLKYKYSMESLKLLNYSAVSFGQNETGLPLFDALASFSLNNPTPRVLAANLQNKGGNFFDAVGSWLIAGGDGTIPKVGVVGLVGASVQKEVKDAAVRFDRCDTTLNTVFKELEAKKPELFVLLYQGAKKDAVACAKMYPQFNVILCLTEQEEPGGTPDAKVGNTLIIGVGHKGRYVGLVGAYRKENGFDLHYQLVAMDPDLKTPAGKEAENPVLALFDKYTQEVKEGNYLSQYPKVPHPVQISLPNATYVGSDRCKKCHPSAYKVWKESPHSHAWNSLVGARRPALREFDGECVKCHVVGFDYKSGFPNGNVALLKDNGCENCHGPCGEHVRDKDNERIRGLINPFKAPADEAFADTVKRLRKIETTCIKCHDTDNDVTWTKEGGALTVTEPVGDKPGSISFKKWDKIIHRTPKDE